MATIATFSVPARSLALSGALTALPSASFVCESTVVSGSGTTTPLLRVTGASREAVEDALAADASVEAVTCLADHSTEFLYRVEWGPEFDFFARVLPGSTGSVLSARASGSDWSIRVLYPGRDALSTAHETCLDHGIDVEVETVRDLDPDRPERFGITNEQREALLAACEHGYFDIPRRTGLRELATDIGISHQALSERLRRGHDTLITETLADGDSAPL
ncbi:helix-turn-helix domain-containing protein [Halomarina oriensis]|uniref:DNA-binding protein n=1 Tax=Halomarina oriensis TaxID=671145 RepID=A0A6B0GHY6_9EURY|nr:helix-turn-helix domain-containing protein [Halomarina oriensis]MWG33039.1 DNA-binding protein [Halomarina oriensis]